MKEESHGFSRGSVNRLLQQAIEEALKQPPQLQNAIAKAIFEQISQRGKQPRPIGLAEGQVEVPDSFFDPLPEEDLALWNGEEPDAGR